MASTSDGTAPAGGPQQLAAVREQRTIDDKISRPSSAARWTALTLASSLACVALLAPWALGTGEPYTPGMLALIGLYVLAYRVEFTASGGSMVPTQPILVALLAAVPLGWVPVCVVTGVLLGSLGPGDQQGYRPTDWAVRVLPAWHCLGPVAVLWAADAYPLDPTLWYWLIPAIASQFLLDALVAAARMASLGVSPRVIVHPLGWTFRVDILMTVIGAGLVLGVRPSGDTERTMLLLGLLSAPILLVRMLGRDRVVSVQQALSMNDAYEAAAADATRDPMTGLLNRRGWESAIIAVDRALAGNDLAAAAVVAADLDGLKIANDTYGHHVGDGLIVAFARLLSDVCPADSVVARLGGDEYAILLPGGDEHAASALVQTIRLALRDHRPIDQARLSASLGCADVPTYPCLADAQLAADLAAGADKQARRAGRDRTEDASPAAHLTEPAS